MVKMAWKLTIERGFVSEICFTHLWVGQVIFLQVVVQPRPGRPEVRDASRGGDARAGHGDDVLGLPGLDVRHDALKGDLIQDLK